MKRIGMLVAMAMFAAGSAVALADNGGVARAQFTTGIDNREPVDQFQRLGTSHDEATFFTELRGLEGRTVTHRWMHDGESHAEVEFDVGGPRWRVWSSKDLLPGWTGAWTVEVVDDTGELHGRWTFVYTGAAGS